MPELLRDLFRSALDRWHTRTGLLGASASLCALFFVLFAGLDMAAVSAAEWAIIAAVPLVVAVAWRYTAYPKNPRGKVGFGVAIEYEEDCAGRLRSDFVLALRDIVRDSQLCHQITFLELSQSIARDITDQERAIHVAKRANLHFLLYGRARLRTHAGSPAYVIDLNGIVRHNAIEGSVAQRFREEFSASLPHRLLIGTGEDVFACEVAARHVDVVARYIIGIAAALSNDFEYAEQLLLDASARLDALLRQDAAVPLSVLLNKVRTRLTELYAVWVARHMIRYSFKRDREALHAAEPLIAKQRALDPDSYQAALCAGICAFVLRRDVAVARQCIESCKGNGDAAWRYSEAFLKAYEGDLDGAYHSYRAAFGAPLEDPTVVTQCEEFIQIVLDEEPERQWLHYCLGLINHRAKGDPVAAVHDFRAFLEGVDPNRFRKHLPIVRKWIDEISVTLDPDNQSMQALA